MTKQTKSKKPSWPKIGTIRKSSKGSYIKFNDGVEILVDGVKVEFNDSRTANLVDPVQEVEKLIERGIISSDKADERREKAQEAAEWLKYEIQVPPPMEKSK